VLPLDLQLCCLAQFSGDAEDGIVSLAVQYLYERVHSGATGAVHDLKWVP